MWGKALAYVRFTGGAPTPAAKGGGTAPRPAVEGAVVALTPVTEGGRRVPASSPAAGVGWATAAALVESICCL